MLQGLKLILEQCLWSASGQDPEENRFNASAALSAAQEQALDRASQETPLHWEDIPASDFLLAFASVNHSVLYGVWRLCLRTAESFGL